MVQVNLVLEAPILHSHHILVFDEEAVTEAKTMGTGELTEEDTFIHREKQIPSSSIRTFHFDEVKSIQTSVRRVFENESMDEYGYRVWKENDTLVDIVETEGNCLLHLHDGDSFHLNLPYLVVRQWYNNCVKYRENQVNLNLRWKDTWVDDEEEG